MLTDFIMKNISVILNIVLIIAVAILYFFQFSVQDTDTMATDIKYVRDTAMDGYAAEMSIVFINVDSLLEKYQLSIDLNDRMLKRKNKLSGELERKVKAFEQEYINFQEKYQRGGFLSQQSLEAEQQKLLQKDQELKQLEYDLTNQFVQEQQDLTIQLHDSISGFLKEFNNDRRYMFIMSHAFGGNLLYADESLDITDTIISALNKRYEYQKELEKDN